MKMLFSLALVLALASSVAAGAAQAQDQNPPDSLLSKEDKAATKKARKARERNGPEVYRGAVSRQRHIIDDAEGAEKDPDPEAGEIVVKEKALKPSKRIKSLSDK